MTTNQPPAVTVLESSPIPNFPAALAAITAGRGKSPLRARGDKRIVKVGDMLRASESFSEFFTTIRKTSTSNQARFHVLVSEELLEVLWELRKDIPSDLVSASQLVSWLMLQGLEKIHLERSNET